MIRKISVIVLAVVAAAGSVFAQGTEHQTSWGFEGAYYPPHNQGWNSDGWVSPSYTPVSEPNDFVSVGLDEGRELGNTWGSVKAQGWVAHKLTLPVLQGKGPLTSGNNLSLNFRGELSPVTAGVSARAIMTPVAFLNFEAGAYFGTGWAALGFNGLGLNRDGSGVPDEGALNGLVSKVWGSGTFQFDLAAVIPGEWNHVLTLATLKAEYRHYSRAEEGDSWMFQGDSGENFNGMRYYTTFVLAYQMPLKVNLAGIMLETNINGGDVKTLSPMDEGGWGSDFLSVSISPLCNIQLGEKASVVILAGFARGKKYTDGTIFYNWFQNRDYESAFWYFDQLAFSFSYFL